MNLSKYKVYRYSSNGILKSRFVFKEDVKEYGKPVAVSNNGHLFILKKKKLRVIHVFMLNHDKLEFLKSINI